MRQDAMGWKDYSRSVATGRRRVAPERGQGALPRRAQVSGSGLACVSLPLRRFILAMRVPNLRA
jgi:hypothetical protein